MAQPVHRLGREGRVIKTAEEAATEHRESLDQAIAALILDVKDLHRAVDIIIGTTNITHITPDGYLSFRRSSREFNKLFTAMTLKYNEINELFGKVEHDTTDKAIALKEKQKVIESGVLQCLEKFVRASVHITHVWTNRIADIRTETKRIRENEHREPTIDDNVCVPYGLDVRLQETLDTHEGAIDTTVHIRNARDKDSAITFTRANIFQRKEDATNGICKEIYDSIKALIELVPNLKTFDEPAEPDDTITHAPLHMLQREDAPTKTPTPVPATPTVEQRGVNLFAGIGSQLSPKK